MQLTFRFIPKMREEAYIASLESIIFQINWSIILNKA